MPLLKSREWNFCSHCIIMPRGSHKNATGMPRGCHMLPTCCLHVAIGLLHVVYMLSTWCHAWAMHLQTIFFLTKMFLFLRAFFRMASTEVLTHPECILGSLDKGGGYTGIVRTYPTPPLSLKIVCRRIIIQRERGQIFKKWVVFWNYRLAKC